MSKFYDEFEQQCKEQDELFEQQCKEQDEWLAQKRRESDKRFNRMELEYQMRTLVSRAKRLNQIWEKYPEKRREIAKACKEHPLLKAAMLAASRC